MTYEEFVSARLTALTRYAHMLTGDHHTAQDLVQETMVRAHLHWRKVCRADAPERYLKRMLLNQYLDWRRGSWLRRVLLRAEQEEPVGGHRDDHAERGAERDMIWSALRTLPRQQRAALVLRFYEDLPDVDIADMLGCSVGTVRGYISRALATLRADTASVLHQGGAR